MEVTAHVFFALVILIFALQHAEGKSDDNVEQDDLKKLFIKECLIGNQPLVERHGGKKNFQNPLRNDPV